MYYVCECVCVQRLRIKQSDWIIFCGIHFLALIRNLQYDTQQMHTISVCDVQLKR